MAAEPSPRHESHISPLSFGLLDSPLFPSHSPSSLLASWHTPSPATSTPAPPSSLSSQPVVSPASSAGIAVPSPPTHTQHSVQPHASQPTQVPQHSHNADASTSQTQPSPPAGPSSSSTTAGSTPSTGAIRRPRARKQRYSRSRTGCLTCRARKVKCDEKHPVCTRCLDLEIECQWLDPAFLAYKPRRRTEDDAAAASGPAGSGSGSASATGTRTGPASMAPSTSGSVNRTASASTSSSTARPPIPMGIPIGVGGVGVGVNGTLARVPMPQHPEPQSMGPYLASRVRAPGTTPVLTAAPAPQPSLARRMTGTSTASVSAAPVSPASSKCSEDRWPGLDAFFLGGFSLPGVGLVAGSSSAAAAAATVSASVSASATTGTSLPVTDTVFNPVALLHSLARHPIPGSSTSPVANPATITAVEEGDKGESTPPKPAGAALPQQPSPKMCLEGSTLARRRRSANRKPAFTLDFIPSTFDAGALSLSSPLTVTLDPLAAAFPSAASRRLFHHFFSLTSSIVIAMSHTSGGSRKNKNPVLNVALPLIVHDTESPARAAFRLGILSLASGHLHHQYLDNGAGGSDDALELLAETRRARRHADAQMMLSLTRQGDAELDLVLATCMMLKTRDVVLSDKGWRRNLEFALRLILQRGGAGTLLNADPQNFARRFVIEQVATTDVFSTFTTGAEPMLLGHGADWWLQHDRSAQSEWQWESYEHQFGISRGMAELVGKCRVIAYRKARVLESVVVARGNSTSPGSDLQFDLDMDLDVDPDLTGIAAAIDDEAWALLDALGAWSLAQQGVPGHTRVLLGDSAYRYAMVVMLLHEVLGVDAGDERVQSAVRCVLELVAEISMEPVMLVWPLLIAGARAVGPDRTWVSTLFDIFRKDHCMDLMTAQTLLAEQWRRIDAGTGFTPWPQLMREMDLEVLLI